MARLALTILTDREKARSFAAAARKRSVELFDYNRIVPQYESLYRGVLESGAG
jgi:hypothetical protein